MIIFPTDTRGLLGSKILEHKDKGFDIVSSRIDITNRERIFDVIKRIAPNVIVHTAGITDVDYCENHKKEAWNVNVEGTRNIVDAASKFSAKVVFISSDYIFDGKDGPYSEEAEPNPINYYGLTKVEGENLTRARRNSLIVRSTIFYGWHPIKLNFATWIIREMRNGKKINVVNDQYGNPTFVNNLAGILLEMAERGMVGIYNVVGVDWINRYEFALRIAERFGLDKDLINPVTSGELNQLAPRPKRVGLKTDKIKSLFSPFTIEMGLNEMKKQMKWLNEK